MNDDTRKLLKVFGVAVTDAEAEAERLAGDGSFTAPWDAKASVAKRDLPGGPHPRRVAARARAIRREAADLLLWGEGHPPPLPR